MVDLLVDLLFPAILKLMRLAIRLVAEVVVEGSVIRIWRRFRSRHLRAEARDWVAAGDWSALRARYADATTEQRQVLLEVGDGHPELADMYAEALYGDWDEVLPAVRVLKKQPELPAIVEEAARVQHEIGGMRAELVRPLRIDRPRAQPATA